MSAGLMLISSCTGTVRVTTRVWPPGCFLQNWARAVMARWRKKLMTDTRSGVGCCGGRVLFMDENLNCVVFCLAPIVALSFQVVGLLYVRPQLFYNWLWECLFDGSHVDILLLAVACHVSRHSEKFA